MHKVLGLLVAAALAAPQGATAQAARQQGPKKVRIAVLDIRPLGTDAAKAELLSEVALTEAASISGCEVIGKSDINSIVGFEKQKQVMGCAEDSTCLAEIGGALGVDYILVGSLGGLGDLFRIDLKLVDSKRAKVRARVGVTVEGKESRLVAAVQKAVHDLIGPMMATEPPPPVAANGKAADPKSAKALTAGLPPPAAMKASPGVSATATDSRRTWAYASGGIGLALLAGGAVAGLQAQSAFDAEKKAAASGDKAGYDSNKTKAGSMSKVADGLFLAGAVGVGIGTWLFFSSGSSAPVALEVAPAPGGAFAAITGGF